MKRKILFVMPSLSGGGAEKSLVTLLSMIDYDMFDVDLFLFKQEGLFLDMLPNNVNLIPIPREMKAFYQDLSKALGELKRLKRYDLYLKRIVMALLKRLSRKNPNGLAWKKFIHACPNLNDNYDIAVGYLEYAPIYFIVDKVVAKQKLGWIHNDYTAIKGNKNFDQSYFEQLKYLVTVSSECKKTLDEYFPHLQENIKVIENIISPKIIQGMVSSEDIYKDNYKGIRLLTIGRLEYQKGYDLAIPAISQLRKSGYEVHWYIIGTGQEQENLRKMIEKYSLENDITFIGTTANPYSYISQCDIYLQPSRYEGKSIAIEEAKILSKKIITTNFTTIKDQITDGENGMIVEMNSNAIFDGLKSLIDNKELGIKYMHNLHYSKKNNENEINKFYMLINNF